MSTAVAMGSMGGNPEPPSIADLGHLSPTSWSTMSLDRMTMTSVFVDSDSKKLREKEK
jgi:hypothetical protein